jgi:hypothetical protein
LSRRIAERCGLPEREIDANRAPASYGLDSLAAIEISVDVRLRRNGETR